MKNRRDGLKMEKEEKGRKQRKPMIYKIFALMENFFGLQGQEREKQIKNEQKKAPNLSGLMF